ncbi:hypothetical protein Pcinc_000190 [Petrolisthes cinctipes]|uniref:BolA-like protein n=1 Tax=Petrolisthes cinctipes TaxID=88211 RepID=A0AAE1GQ28_PETCI|nr:hypothetical protein Pcinc_000190 [Petrolisthes cinctipes]
MPITIDKKPGRLKSATPYASQPASERNYSLQLYHHLQMSKLWRLVSPLSYSRKSIAQLHAKMSTGGPVEATMRRKLEAALSPTHLDIINESFMHNVPPDSETHFKVVVVAKAFNDLPIIKRHRLVNSALSEELQSGVHALSIMARTPAQWTSEPQEVERSPACRGGFGK